MKIVDGKNIAHRIRGEIIELLKVSGPKTLAIVYVGEHPVIDSYVALKKRVGAELGIPVEVIRYQEEATTDEVLIGIQKAAESHSGIIVQLPLPAHLDRERILNAVPSTHDVDVLSAEGYQDFTKGVSRKLPPVVAAIKEIVTAYEIGLMGKTIVIVGKGLLVGRPVAAWLSREGASYTMIDKEHDDATEVLRGADIIISGAGAPSLVTADMIKNGVVLIDAGTSTASGKIRGDIDPACYSKASVVSPVPGGIGPITVVSLFRNIFL